MRLRLLSTAAVTAVAVTATALLASPALAAPKKGPKAQATASPSPVAVEPVLETVTEPVEQVVATTMDALATPLLTRPELLAPTTVWLKPSTPVLQLDPVKDYVVKVDPTAVFTSGAAIVGGRNVVLENALLQYAPPAGAPADWQVRGLFLKAQYGVMYVDGLRITGPLNDGIQMDQKAPRAAVVLKHVRIDQVTGTYEGHHADLLQTWAGPARLVVDDFEGTSNYQGFFLKPNQLWADGPRPEFFWLNDVRLDLSTGYYALWTDGFGAFPVQTRGVVVKAKSANRDAWLWPKPSTGDLTWVDVLGIL